jgi:hypothetical protein
VRGALHLSSQTINKRHLEERLCDRLDDIELGLVEPEVLPPAAPQPAGPHEG